MYKAVFFDLDDTMITHGTAIRYAAGRLFCEVVGSDEIERTLFKKHWIHLNRIWYQKFLAGNVIFQEHGRGKLREALAPYGITLSNQKADAILNLYWNDIMACRLYDDVLPCFEQLTQWNLGIVTNGADVQQRRKILQCALTDYVDVIMTSEFAGISKPNLKIYIKACELIVIPADECVFVGDDINSDVTGASNAGLQGIWIDRIYSAQNDDIETIHSLMDLPVLLKR